MRLAAALALALLAPAALSGCIDLSEGGGPSATTQPPYEGPAFEEPARSLLASQDAGGEEPGWRAITTESAWERFWQRSGADGDAPAVDFPREFVLVVTAGAMPNLCNHVRVTGATTVVNESVTVVEATRFHAPPTMFCGQAVVHPLHAVALPWRGTDIVVEWRDATGVPADLVAAQRRSWNFSSGGGPWASVDPAIADWDAPPVTGHPVDVVLNATEVAEGGALKATAWNLANDTVAFHGSDCGLHLAREENGTWVVFAAAPGHFDAQLGQLPPGRACTTSLDLDRAHTARNGSVALAGVAPGDYRAVFLGQAEVEGEERTVLAWAPFEVVAR